MAESISGGSTSGRPTGMVAGCMGLPAISYVAASPACMAEGIPPSVSRCVALRWTDMVWLAEVGRSIWARVRLDEGPIRDSRE